MESGECGEGRVEWRVESGGQRVESRRWRLKSEELRARVESSEWRAKVEVEVEVEVAFKC